MRKRERYQKGYYTENVEESKRMGRIKEMQNREFRQGVLPKIKTLVTF